MSAVMKSNPKAESRKTSRDVLHALARKHEGMEWAFVTNVANQTGSTQRYADALAFNLWRSRGHYLTGFEIKVNRGDWLNEMRRPEKADPIAKFCHFWYLVTGNGDEAKFDEIPKTWGWLNLDGRGLVELKKPKLMNPVEPSMGFLAAFIRRVNEGMIPRETIQAQLDAAHARGKDEEKAYGVPYQMKRASEDLAALKLVVNTFEEATGIRLNKYTSTQHEAATFKAARELLTAIHHIERSAISLRTLEKEAGTAATKAEAVVKILANK